MESKYLVIGIEERDVNTSMLCNDLDSAITHANLMLENQMEHNGNPVTDPDVQAIKGQEWSYANDETMQARSNLEPNYDVIIIDLEDVTRKYYPYQDSPDTNSEPMVFKLNTVKRVKVTVTDDEFEIQRQRGYLGGRTDMAMEKLNKRLQELHCDHIINIHRTDSKRKIHLEAYFM